MEAAKVEYEKCLAKNGADSANCAKLEKEVQALGGKTCTKETAELAACTRRPDKKGCAEAYVISYSPLTYMLLFNASFC